jgi:hypothetical protein
MPDGKELMPPMMIETSTGRRPVRAILRGTTTVRPNPRRVLREDGREEILDPKTARLSPDHWIVRRRPEWFHPTESQDRATADVLLRMLKRAEREELELIRALGTGPHRRRMRLPDRDALPWRLP